MKKYIKTNKVEKQATVTPLKEWGETLKYLQDIIKINERTGEPTISFEEVIERLRADGYIE